MPLPRSIPAEFTQQLQTSLAAAGVTFDGSIKPGTRVTHEVAHHGVMWELTYVLQVGGEPTWRITGPGDAYSWGPAASTADAVAAITAPPAAPEPAPAPDPYEGAPRTHLGVRVPEFVRAEWSTDRAQWWRLGVATALGQSKTARTF
ncbi:hypothetical protein [Streptomyces anulatus]|uniref:hypothetical protein n=1 Tax=Streptomyces anulatus TaxID=1892 RepID=UPI0037DD558D|nr:hypothetical protein OHB50_39570 [Streptomyces anulatus]